MNRRSWLSGALASLAGIFGINLLQKANLEVAGWLIQWENKTLGTMQVFVSKEEKYKVVWFEKAGNEQVSPAEYVERYRKWAKKHNTELTVREFYL